MFFIKSIQKTPLMIAVKNGNVDIIRILLSNPLIDVNLKVGN